VKRDNPLVDGGSLALGLGAMAFFPPLFDYEFFITAWLGGMQQPVGLSAMIVGGVLLAIGKLRDFRNSSPLGNPTDAVVTPNELRPAAPPETQQPAETPRT
jgi:hypothetical protein